MIYPSRPGDVKKFDHVVKRGHFILTTGRHSGVYINKDAIPLHRSLFGLVIKRMSVVLGHLDKKYDTIVSPAVAGIPFGSPLAYKKKKLFIYPEKKGDKMVFREVLREGLKGKKVIIVEDIITTGGSIDKTIAAVEEAGAEVVGSLGIWLRAEEPPPSNKLLYAVVHESVDSYDPDDICPLCEKDIPLTHPKTGEIL